MRFNCPANELKDALAVVAGAVNDRASLPMLACVLIEASGQGIRLTGNNLNMVITHTLHCKVEREGAIGLPLKKLMTAVSSLGAQDVELLALNDTQARIASGDFTYTASGVAAEEMPKVMARADDFRCEFATVDLLRALKFLRPIECHNEAFYNRCGISFLFTADGVELAAINGPGHHFGKANFACKTTTPVGRKFFLPIYAADQLRRLDIGEQAIHVAWGEACIHFDFGATQMTTKLVSAEFPDYTKLLERHLKREPFTRVQRSELKELIDRVTVAGTILGLRASQRGIYLHCRSQESGDSRDHLPFEQAAPDRAEAEIWMEAKYPLGTLSAIDEDEIEVFMETAQPLLIRTPHCFSLIMGRGAN
ncbi:hypothetical protein [Cerasicoccus frondis]|uniref:hypothetical protein n=1 Tax=Cerasicoccus frondis TaxID=490090 RepID=UPI0028527419|nr:hypothetical protein [Cerasicoccus frondis]